MTDALPVLVPSLLGLPVLAALFSLLRMSARRLERVNGTLGCLTAGIAAAVAAIAIDAAPQVAWRSGWFVVDAIGGVFIALIGAVGLASVLTSPGWLRTSGRGWAPERHSRRFYYTALNLFWAALLAIPIVANLGLAWLLVEATTAASALLVAFSGSRAALEAGWKYVVLTSLGLAVALLGIVVIYLSIGGEDHGLSRLDWRTLQASSAGLPQDAGMTGVLLILTGLAAKIGWAPVHNWLPDAHSEAPPPVSALLSAALLPTVLLVAWRVKLALGESVGDGALDAVFIGFGLISLAVAVPFLWRALPWKRLLAYSSLEHMGVLALGIGFGSRLAIAGVVLHVAAHAVAKALGFYAAIPLLRADPAAGERQPAGVAARSPGTAAAMGLSLGGISGLPPMPLFVSELMILLGGIEAGHLAVTAIAAALLALGFLGLAHAALEGVIGDAGPRPEPVSGRPAGLGWSATAIAAVLLAALTCLAVTIPDSGLTDMLMREVL